MLLNLFRITCLIALTFFLMSCGDKDGQDGEGGHRGFDSNNDVKVSQLFDISGASAVATGHTEDSGDESDDNTLIKFLDDGRFVSLFKRINPDWHIRISAIEIGPDKSVYIALKHGVWVHDDTSLNEDGEIPDFSQSPSGRNIAFFRIYPNGKTVVVDPYIEGVGGYSHQDDEFTKKPIQFDKRGNLYYVGRTAGTTVLKKKTPDGTITQIGNSNMEIRGFHIDSKEQVVFHGNNKNDWQSEWIRVFMNDGSVRNIYYSDGQGWLRGYYLNNKDELVLIGNNLLFGNTPFIQLRFSGIVKIDYQTESLKMTPLYNERNFWNGHNHIGDQIVGAHWRDSGDFHFFKLDQWSNQVKFPLSLNSEVTNTDIIQYIRESFVYPPGTNDDFDLVDFNNVDVDDEDELKDFIHNKLPEGAKSWYDLKHDLHIENMNFSNAQKFFVGTGGGLFAVMQGHSNNGHWANDGEVIFSLLNGEGELDVRAFPQDSRFKNIVQVKIIDNNLVFLAKDRGESRIFSIASDLSSGLEAISPLDDSIEIFSFVYHLARNEIIYDVYDLSNNSTYLLREKLGNGDSVKSEAERMSLTDIIQL